MNKVTTINLNGIAFNIEEAGYEMLLAYLGEAKASLQNNPGQDEIISDLERAIGEKFSVYLNANKNVITTSEVKQVIEQMGPVETPAGETNKNSEEPIRVPKKLYRINEGAMIAGVCNGLAAYFNIDVTLMRIIFVILTIITSGAWLIAYIVMMFVIPDASTPEEKARARGLVYNTQELINRAKSKYESFKKKDWNRRDWTWKEPEMERNGFSRGVSAIASAGASVMIIIIGIIRAALAITFILGLISLVTTGAILGIFLPIGVPLWIGIVLLLAAYSFINWPLRIIQNSIAHPLGDARRFREPVSEAVDGLVVIGFIAIFFWLAYTNIPAFRETVDQTRGYIQERTVETPTTSPTSTTTLSQ